MIRAYYNEFDKAAAAWLRELIRMGVIADGDVDERSIEDVLPSDLHGYTQCHFFAGIGGWSYALRLAGWPDDRPVWTGSCPCQPFSAAGKGSAFDDERHLWPAFHHLVKECGAAVVLGEQVASKDADAWLDLVQTDMEGLGYAFGASPFPSASVGAPHIRDRLYWGGGVNQSRAAGDVGTASSAGLEGQRRRHQAESGRNGEVRSVAEAGELGGLADPNEQQRHGSGDGRPTGRGEFANDRAIEQRPGPTNGHWRDADWLFCRDGKWRPVEPGTFPLVDGLPRGVVPSSRIGMAIDANKTAEARVMRLRGYGNAINPVQAALFIEVFMESMK